MEKFVFDCLREISNAAQSIDKAVGKIIGWELGRTQWGQRPPEYQDEQTYQTVHICNKTKQIVSKTTISKNMQTKLSKRGKIRKTRSFVFEITTVL